MTGSCGNSTELSEAKFLLSTLLPTVVVLLYVPTGALRLPSLQVLTRGIISLLNKLFLLSCSVMSNPL